ncbi:MAG: glycoside hydrolase TIM-barrel-like domain-containing protein [Xanthobacteraceae bacterium]
MTYINGVNLLPATGEWTYDSVPYQGRRAGETAFAQLNLNANPGGSKTDCDYALDQLQAAFPGCGTVALVVAWFGSSTSAAACQVYPSTTFIGGAFEKYSGGAWVADNWQVSSLTQGSPGLVAIPTSGGAEVYGGTPSDQSVVRCIQDLKARGFRVVFYPFLLMTCDGLPWRGNVTFAPDLSAAATSAVDAFLGSASAVQFTRDAANLTVAYAGPATDFTYRRMILHYANLVVLAGGVDLFLLGSELRGLETVRGPGWTKAGTTGGDGRVTWDYPFVDGLIQLSDAVRGVFDAASLTKDTSGLHNLVSYSADWSVWMGVQHPGANGQWPHLDQLYGHDNIDLVCFDNYLPLSDWTTGDGGLDGQNWLAPAPPGTWPPTAATFSGLGLGGQPTIYAKAYLKANIEGGQYFNWFYNDGSNLGIGLDPNGTDLRVSVPAGDRLTQSRNAYAANQQLLAPKQLRWWWNNSHQAVYDDGDGTGWQPHGPVTEWIAQSKSIAFVEYGFATCDRSTNQPNVFFDPASSASGTAFWSIWDPSASGAGGYAPRYDGVLATLALQAVYEYWLTDGNNMTSAAGVPMVQAVFMSAWNWDARPFPAFPTLANVWGDAPQWPAGLWLNGKTPFLAPPIADAPPSPGPYSLFPSLPAPGWSIRISPRFATRSALHVSGREARAGKFLTPLWQIELEYNLLRMVSPNDELQTILDFFAQCAGEDTAFYFAPPGLSPATVQLLGIGDGAVTTFPFMVSIGGFALSPAGVGSVSALCLDGIASGGGYTIDSAPPAPSVSFATPPGSGVILTASFDWYLLCRFEDDDLDVEEFMAQLYALQSLRLTSVRS